MSIGLIGRAVHVIMVPSTRFYRSFADFKAAIEAAKDVKLT